MSVSVCVCVCVCVSVCVCGAILPSIAVPACSTCSVSQKPAERGFLQYYCVYVF